MDLDIKRVLQARPGAPEGAELTRLMTVWGETMDVAKVLPEHPRPQFERKAWKSLNGYWDYAIVESSSAKDLWRNARPPQHFDGTILVPFSPESTLSGVQRKLLPSQLLWYRRTVRLSEPEPGRCLQLHFDAVDYACACYVNGVQVGTHVGGYLPFDLDITSAVRVGDNVVELCVYDPSEHGTQLRGKQRIRRGNMWYTAQSGIWQTVWLEEVPDRHITSVQTHVDADGCRVLFEADVVNPDDGAGNDIPFAAELLDAEGAVVARTGAAPVDGKVRCELALSDPHLWQPDDPYLYGLRFMYGDDRVRSYCAFRTVGVEPDEQGTLRFCLNHRPFFVRGLLDQGYWPDGLMTPPADEALVADIRAAKDAGFNMLRKHIKVEVARWYWHCDRMGMLVWQDMVSGGDLPGEWASVNIPTLIRRSWTSRGDRRESQWRRYGAGDPAYREEWLATARAAIRMLSSHPCIASWVVFNESWGQFRSEEMTELLREVDPTRPYVSTSGWYDQGAGDFFAVHNYFRSMRVYRDPKAGLFKRRQRAFLIDEFGGLTCPVEGHTSVATVYGYDAYEDQDTWRQALRDLLAEMDALEAEGLSGFVYTQISDVEEETNGLLTYDRRVNKLLG